MRFHNGQLLRQETGDLVSIETVDFDAEEVKLSNGKYVKFKDIKEYYEESSDGNYYKRRIRKWVKN